MNQLVTASVGLYISGSSYYIQIIFADTGAQQIFKISYYEAQKISKEEKIEIADYN